MKCLWGAVISLVLIWSPAMADIYVKRLPDGTLCYTNRPVGNQWDKYLEEKPSGPPGACRRDEYDAMIRQIALSEGMDPELILGIVQVESQFNPRAKSPKGAMGLMQLMPQTASLMGVVDPWDPHENLTAGVRYFSSLLKRYDGDVSKALAAYNAGPSAVDVYNGIPPYQETRQYVKNVLAIFNGGGK
ncbi:MAG: lytic transglycosylase domain-containing protein [Desulfomonilia bacterium]